MGNRKLYSKRDLPNWCKVSTKIYDYKMILWCIEQKLIIDRDYDVVCFNGSYVWAFKNPTAATMFTLVWADHER